VVSAEELIQQALDVRQRAYAPYSRYQVGAAVLTADGDVTVGCNVENASYPATICAERVALTAAIARGKNKLAAIAIATANGGTPCGICRQVMAELGPEMTVYISDEHGNFRVTDVVSLLPDSFNGSDLVSGRQSSG
jgi:cytidine deaminase